MRGEPVFIFGAGGFGCELAWLISEIDPSGKRYDLRGFIDDDPAKQGRDLNGLPVFSLDQARELAPGAIVARGVGAPRSAKAVMTRCMQTGFRWGSFIDPQTRKSSLVEVGQGTVICAGCVLTTNVRLGRQVQVNPHCTIMHNSELGDYVSLAPGVRISGFVIAGEGAYFGTGAVVINGSVDRPLVIGDWAVVGAGACVLGDVPPGQTVAGVPAKPLRKG